MENQKKEKEITFGYLIEVFKKSFVFMLLAAIVLGAIGVVYSKFLDKPSYQFTATFIVTNNSPEDYTTSNLTVASTSIAATCVELATHDAPAEAAVDEHGLCEVLGIDSKSECIKAVKNMLSAKKSADETTCTFSITVKSDDRKATYAVTKAIQDVFPDVAKDKLSNNESDLVASTSFLSGESDVSAVKSSPLKVGFILAVVAAVITYCIFFVKTLLDKSIYDEESIKENFSYPIVGVIPSFSTSEEQAEMRKYKKMKKGDQTVVPRNYNNKLLSEDSPFYMAESFNSLRTNVIFAAAAAKNPVFAVTSDVAAAGKTVVSANLGISLANLGKKVLLVECDMRCPAFKKLFAKESKSGLSELLAGIETDTSKLTFAYESTSLDILSCGKIPPNPSELLSGYRMTELVNEWKSTYDYVILDMPPIGEVYDAGVVSNIVNGYIVTVRARHSNLNDVKTAVERVEAVNGSVLGMILNDVKLKTGKNYKSYYYSQH